MMTVHEVSRLAGVSVRALHHYDAIGLLKPSRVTEAGYRLYDEDALSRLQEILLFRELEFPLGEIKRILDSPGYDRRQALCDQRELLKLKREKLTKLISLTENILKGDDSVDFSAFDDSKEKEYAEEAKRRWGNTPAWREYEAKKPGADAAAGLMELFSGFGKLKELPASDARVTEAVRSLKNYISENYYECTDAILLGLGQMYSGDPRFRENIDRAGGEGTAEFVKKAIEEHCKNGRKQSETF